MRRAGETIRFMLPPMKLSPSTLLEQGKEQNLKKGLGGSNEYT